MSDKFWKAFYNFFFLAPFYLFMKFSGLFSAKVRKGIRGRKDLFENLKTQISKVDQKKPLIWFHSSSMGEFEQAKPIIEKLKKVLNINILVTFFSPSGFEPSRKYKLADIVSYLPLDTTGNAEKFIKTASPRLMILMRYDIWPNHIRVLHKMKIPIMLVDATMRENSPRKRFPMKSFHRNLYRKISKIFTVSKNDIANFREFVRDQDKIQVMGDTRFDRVFERSIAAKEKDLIRKDVTKDKTVFIAGSIWPEDEEVLFPALKKALKYHKGVLYILVPHEPTIEHLEKIENDFAGHRTIRFSHMNSYSGEEVIIVDSMGILLTLYNYGHIAFVGGSFKSNVHNVLEAAVYGMPVFYGPKIGNSQEASELAETGGGLIIENRKQLYKRLSRMIDDDAMRERLGGASRQYVQSNTGATEKILKEVYTYL